MPKFHGHDYCGKTCAAEAGKQKKPPPQRGGFPKPPSPVVSSPFAPYNSFYGPDRSESPDLCENCYARPKSQEKDDDGTLITHSYCGIRCALTSQSSTLLASNIPAPAAGTISKNPSDLLLERFKTPIGRSILLMMQERWQSDELGPSELKSVYRIGLSEDVYRRFDLALQTNDGCPVTATYCGCIATCNIVDDNDPAPCGSGSCELCDVLRSSFGNVPYGASSRDGAYGPGIYTYKNPALAHNAMISDGGQQSQDMNYALIQCRVVTQSSSGPSSKSFPSFTDDAGVTFCAQSTAIIPTHLLRYSLEAPPHTRTVLASANADMALMSTVASVATPASGGHDQAENSSNTGPAQAKVKPWKGKGKGRGKGPLPEPARQNEPTKPSSATSSDQQTSQGGTGSAVNQTVPTPSPPSPPGLPAPRSRSNHAPAAQIQAWLAPNGPHPGANDASQGGPALETFVPPRAPSPPPAPATASGAHTSIEAGLHKTRAARIKPAQFGVRHAELPLRLQLLAAVASDPAIATLRALMTASPPGGWPSDSTTNTESPPDSSSLPPNTRADDGAAHGVQSSSQEVSLTQLLNNPNMNGKDHAAPKGSSRRSDLSPNKTPSGPRRPGSVSHEPNRGGQQKATRQSSNPSSTARVDDDDALDYAPSKESSGRNDLNTNNSPPGSNRPASISLNSNRGGQQKATRQSSNPSTARVDDDNALDYTTPQQPSGRSDSSPNNSPTGSRRPASVSSNTNRGGQQKPTRQSSSPLTGRADSTGAGKDDDVRSTGSATTAAAAGTRKNATRPKGPKARMDEDDHLGADDDDDLLSGGELNLTFSSGSPFNVDTTAGGSRKSARRARNSKARLDEDDN
ncbi:hypothetical protein FS837_003458 [Tulasnella sp. UAMH 9824]|nr:hypothetical protein FS837_003458 [Tulasnella sp. UAMH 9824]